MASQNDDGGGGSILKYATKERRSACLECGSPAETCGLSFARGQGLDGGRAPVRGGEALAGLSQPPADPQRLGWWERCNGTLRLARQDLSKGNWKDS